jgi:hypothetical protein
MYILHRLVNVGIGTEAALFPEKEYIMEISFAVCEAVLHLYVSVYVQELYAAPGCVCL